ncbi:MAG: CxxxxCH/CxxCH domain-containing protein [Calditrichaeota bacterium]|nr:CxxxxCH/CxxCH domain-containing protein [Calditrichota bacterium]
MTTRDGKERDGAVRRAVILLPAAMLCLGLALLYGCSEEAGGPLRTTHPAGWSDPGSSNFHGKAVLGDLLTTSLAEIESRIASCRSCHGPDSSAGQKATACFICHDQFPHPAGWAGAGGENLHASHLRRTNWNLTRCKDCHGSDYNRLTWKIGDSPANCRTCHTGSSGPEGCRVCHGGTFNSAPPPDLIGREGTEFVTVGAHQAHLTDNRISNPLACSACHSFAGFASQAHIDTITPGVAEVTFGVAATDSGRTTPVWDRNAGTCSSVYCHGSITRSDGIMRDGIVAEWTRVDGSQRACGTCHAMPPPDPHPPLATCNVCHVYAQTTHVNGTIDMR